jgi:hypothetical protein
MCSVTSEGSTSVRFAGAIKQGDLFAAEPAAREKRGLSLDEALDLCELIAKAKPGKSERAAIRWHGRLCLRRGRSS